MNPKKVSLPSENGENRNQRFPVKTAIFRLMALFLLSAWMLRRVSILAGLCAAVPFLSVMIFSQKLLFPQKLFLGLLLSLPMVGLSCVLMAAWGEYSVRAWLVPWLLAAVSLGVDGCVSRKNSFRHRAAFRLLLIGLVLFSCFLT